jgi:8-oxo-dGTP pyrophosphatase MutT (NUDIX family)
MNPWKVVKSRQTYKDKWLGVRTDTVDLPNGETIENFHVIEYNEWSAVLAFRDDGRLVIIREYRHGCQAVTLGLPAGNAEPGETDYEAVARRELLEETGYEATEWVKTGHAYSNWANQNNQVHFFIAFGARKVAGQSLDPTEEIDVLDMDYEDYLNFEGITPQQCHHAAALHYAERYFARHPHKRPVA